MLAERKLRLLSSEGLIGCLAAVMFGLCTVSFSTLGLAQDGPVPADVEKALLEDLEEYTSLLKKGRHRDALLPATRSAQLVQARLPKEHAVYRAVLSRLATIEFQLGDSRKAVKILDDLIATAELFEGKDSLAVADLLNLRGLYKTRFDFDDGIGGLTDLERALGIAKQSIAKLRDRERSNALLATVSYQLAIATYNTIGDFDRALELLDISEQAFRRLPTVDPLAIARSQEVRARILLDQNEPAKAEPVSMASVQTFRERLPPDHPDLSYALVELGRIRQRLGKTTSAERLFDEATAIREKAYGSDHIQSLRARHLKALLELQLGRLQSARDMLRQIADTQAATLGRDSRPTIRSLHDLAIAEASSEAWAGALSRIDDARRRTRRYSAWRLPALNDNEQLAFLKYTDQDYLHSALSMSLERRQDPDWAAAAASWLANAKAIAQEAAAHRVILARDGDTATLDQLEIIRREISQLEISSATVDGTTGNNNAEARARLSDLEREEREMIRRAGASVGALAADDPWVELEAIRRTLPAGSVAVDIARFRVRDYRFKSVEGTAYSPWRAPRYVAWIIPPAAEGGVMVIDLGPADAIDAAATAYCERLQADMQPGPDGVTGIRRDGEVHAEEALRRLAEPLSDLTIRPILGALMKADGKLPEELVICPDGKLWMVPFASLIDAKGRYVVETLATRHVTSTRNLAQPKGAHKPRRGLSRPLVMANPSFDEIPTDTTSVAPSFVRTSKSSDSRSSNPLSTFDRKRIRYDPLQGALLEARAVGPEIARMKSSGGQPEIITGRDATETRFKRAEGPAVVYLATHGTFLPDQTPGDGRRLVLPSDSGSPLRAGRDARGQAIENPLRRCWLAFTGCNLAGLPADRDDGLLTGLEIVGCDLRGTDLVILSACQTAVGDVETGEGVAGLRQAFQLAGARTVIATLWSIVDEETPQLMKDFVDEVADGRRTSQALRTAQLRFIKNRRELQDCAHPGFWAAFTVNEN